MVAVFPIQEVHFAFVFVAFRGGTYVYASKSAVEEAVNPDKVRH